MKRKARSSSAAEGSQAARRKGGGRRPPQKKQLPIGKLHKLGLAVREFVEAAVGPDGHGAPGSLQQPACDGRRNRREMRKEKRKLKRGRRRRLLIGGGEAKCPLPSRAGPAKKRTPLLPPPVGEERKEKVKKKEPPAKAQPPAKQPQTAPSATAEARKRALLAANEAEEREIRRLERQLGLHKRGKKRRRLDQEWGEAKEEAASLPQSFARDGLDYVLEALKSEAAFSDLYENGDMEEGEGSETEEEERLSPGQDGEDEMGSSGESSPEEENESESESEEGEASREAAGQAGGFQELKSTDINIAKPEKQNCQAWRPEVK